jgi:hypothetical protein
VIERYTRSALALPVPDKAPADLATVADILRQYAPDVFRFDEMRRAVMVMKSPVKPAKCSVYVKSVSVSDPPRRVAVQFGFGQLTAPEIAGGDGLTEVAGTVRFPFFGERSPLVELAVTVVVWDSTSEPPLLVQSTVPE